MTTATATRQSAAKAPAPPKPTTTGPCLLCGSGSCPTWRFAALTEEGHVDHGALLTAHKVTPAEVKHDDEGNVIVGDGSAPVLVPMAAKETASHKRNGGRVGPLQVRKARRGRR